ncbi:MAG: CxxxxCH/CxxCH domain-containing protein [Thermodesulfobacteriota bacterium]
MVKDDALTCDNVYCHSDGKSSVDGRRVTGRSLAWDGSASDPQGDSDTCNNCHGRPPAGDAHWTHISRGCTCELCHATSVQKDPAAGAISIRDRSIHVNGRMDVVAAPQFFAHQAWQPLSFVYQPKVGGGTCSSNACHISWRFSNPIDWRNELPPAELPPPAPTALTMSSTSVNGLAFSWRHLPHGRLDYEEGFTVERSLTGTGGWVQIGTAPAINHAMGGTSSSFVDQGLEPNTP